MLENSIERLRYLVNVIPGLLKNITEEDFSFKATENKWSKKQILGHLIDSATNNHHRFIRSQFEKNPVILYNQNDWNKFGYYQMFDSNQLIDFWTVYNKQLLGLLLSMPSEYFQLTCYVEENELFTLENVLYQYLTHLEHHLEQLAGKEF